MVVFVLLASFTHGAHATEPAKGDAASAPPQVQSLGKETVAVEGPCQFHIGDDPAWASPAFDSSAWEKIRADQPWGTQGHAKLTGSAWYRCSIAISQSRGEHREFSLLVPKIRDSYEVYWNGALVGHNGRLPPYPLWYISQPMQTFSLGHAQQDTLRGVLAFRVWKAPLLSDDSGELGGFDTAPLIGTPEAIATAEAAADYHWLRTRQLHFAANLLSGAIALLSLLLWLRSPKQWVLFWMTGFALAQPLILLLLNAHLGLPYLLAMAAGQPLTAIQDISLWFLLLWLLRLRESMLLCRATRVLAAIYMAAAVLDGIMVALSGYPQWARPAQAGDTIVTIFIFLMEALPLVLVGYALVKRRHFDSARWLVATLALLDAMLLVFGYVVKQGRQFTGWAIADKIDAPIFFLDGNGITLTTLSGILLLVAIVYGVYDKVREDQRRQNVLELEKLELQRESNRMRHHAEHDGLTGLLNRRVIVERLGEEMIRARREGSPLSVILADVDHFKRVNDTFGHLAGDLILKEVGAVFSRALRSYDCVGRYGGEEFLIILPKCEMESALLRGEQLRETVQTARIMDGETLLEVTASFGVALVLPSHDDAEDVLRAADAALYQAKSSGRNCVIAAEMGATVCS